MTDHDKDRLDDEAPEHVDPDHAEEQDFAMRNVAMSNTMPTGGQPAAGAIVGSAGRVELQPETDEEIVEEGGVVHESEVRAELDADRDTEAR